MNKFGKVMIVVAIVGIAGYAATSFAGWVTRAPFSQVSFAGRKKQKETASNHMRRSRIFY